MTDEACSTCNGQGKIIDLDRNRKSRYPRCNGSGKEPK